MCYRRNLESHGNSRNYLYFSRILLRKRKTVRIRRKDDCEASDSRLKSERLNSLELQLERCAST